MAYKKGQDLYRVHMDETDGTCELEIWKVSSIKGKRTYAILVLNGFTWGVRSGKQGGIGWKKNIPEWCRNGCYGDKKFNGIYITRFQAWNAGLKSIRKWLRERGEWELTAEEKIQYTKAHRTCERMVKKYSRKRVKK